MSQSEYFSLETSASGSGVKLLGDWSLPNLSEISKIEFNAAAGSKITIDGSQLSKLDTAGAAFALKIFAASGDGVDFANFNSSQLNLLKLVKERQIEPLIQGTPDLSPIPRTGKTVIDVLIGIKDLTNFLGQTVEAFFSIAIKPKLLRVRELFVQLENVCIDAIPIVALVTFLIGVVISYLYASQMQRYGANIFIVDAVTIAMCRELSPLIVAIIMAGRSGSAFTAQIGTMKINEEIDALLTLGLSPLNVLVIPRVLALMIAMPLLVFVGDIAGSCAGAMIAQLYLGITPITFLDRLHSIIKLKTLLVGLCKAPVFAAIIAVIGCQMGLNVENNARSVGLNTTSTVVQSIVAVILLNAAFAILLVELKI